jgi:hypothetical protein
VSDKPQRMKPRAQLAPRPKATCRRRLKFEPRENSATLDTLATPTLMPHGGAHECTAASQSEGLEDHFTGPYARLVMPGRATFRCARRRRMSNGWRSRTCGPTRSPSGGARVARESASGGHKSHVLPMAFQRALFATSAIRFAGHLRCAMKWERQTAETGSIRFLCKSSEKHRQPLDAQGPIKFATGPRFAKNQRMRSRRRSATRAVIVLPGAACARYKALHFPTPARS